MSALPFDRIAVVLGPNKGEYSIGEFLKLPLSDRVKSILFGDISFSAGGQPVNATDALKALRALGTER